MILYCKLFNKQGLKFGDHSLCGQVWMCIIGVYSEDIDKYMLIKYL